MANTSPRSLRPLRWTTEASLLTLPRWRSGEPKPSSLIPTQPESVPKTSATTACFGLSSPRGHLLNSTPTRISLLLPTSSMDDPEGNLGTAPRRNSLQPFLMLSTQPDGCDILAPGQSLRLPSAAEAIYHGVSKLLLQFAPL